MHLPLCTIQQKWLELMQRKALRMVVGLARNMWVHSTDPDLEIESLFENNIHFCSGISNRLRCQTNANLKNTSVTKSRSKLYNIKHILNKLVI